MNAPNVENAATPDASTTPGITAAGCMIRRRPDVDAADAIVSSMASSGATRAGANSATTAASSANAPATAKARSNRVSSSSHSPMIGPTPIPPNTATEK